MKNTDHGWIDGARASHERLTTAATTIIKGLLETQRVDFLSVDGRTKTAESIREKILRKSYNNPQRDITDISGIRIITFLEAQVKKVCDIIEATFDVDTANSLNQDDLLKADQTGYRSVHYVCSLGKSRAQLPEFQGLEGLQFEIQVRTVLQHAWAEMAHDRNYKFSGKLPPHLECQLFLYAGLLELADRGFDELAASIDQYKANVEAAASKGDLDAGINSVSLPGFVEQWAQENGFGLEPTALKANYADLVAELKEFGITTLRDLQALVPADYASKLKEHGLSTNIYGALRDWMLIKDWRRYRRDVDYAWSMGHPDEVKVLELFLDAGEVREMFEAFMFFDDYDER